MGKAKTRKRNAGVTPYGRSKASEKLQSAKRAGPAQQLRHKASNHQAQPSAQPLPFEAASRILLVGEGDFSFAVSLAIHYGCFNLTATTLETKEQLLIKYPQAADNLEALASRSQTVLFSIDATKLGMPHAAGASSLRRSPGFDVVVFNFPHVGGKSTDVNRQVRANQELVVKFLEGAKRVLGPLGAVVVTIFEGQPYELWGLRNLARHAGLGVERSMRFDRNRFPGYSHARTLGNVEMGWKGENREARIYILRKKGEEYSESSKRSIKNTQSDDDEGSD